MLSCSHWFNVTAHPSRSCVRCPWCAHASVRVWGKASTWRKKNEFSMNWFIKRGSQLLGVKIMAHSILCTGSFCSCQPYKPGIVYLPWANLLFRSWFEIILVPRTKSTMLNYLPNEEQTHFLPYNLDVALKCSSHFLLLIVFFQLGVRHKWQQHGLDPFCHVLFYKYL